MNILVVNGYGKYEILASDFVPRIGEKVDLFYEPLPSVTSVVAWPTRERLNALKINDDIDAIITVS